MRSKTNTSAYSKMYLVSTPVYNKLLSCLDEVDKQSTMDLNKEVETEVERPSNRIINDLNNQQPVVENQQQPLIEEIEPVVEQQQVINDDEDRHVDDIAENTNDIIDTVQEPPPPIAQPVAVDPNNKLNTPCNSSSNNKILKIKKKLRFNPVKSEVMIKVPSTLVPPGRKIQDLYKCDICGKQLARKWGLIRHKQTIHKVEESPESLQPDIEPENIEVDEPEQVVDARFVKKPAIKRSATDAKLRHLIPKRVAFRSPVKTRSARATLPTIKEENNEFDKWVK